MKPSPPPLAHAPIGPGTSADSEGHNASCWQQALDYLEAKDAKLLNKYDELLRNKLQGLEGNGWSSREDTDVRTHQNLTRLIDHTLTHLDERGDIVQKALGHGAEVVSWAKDWIGMAVQASPQAALAWSAVSLALPLLTKPAAAEKAFQTGFIYVTSRMRYYVALEELTTRNQKDPVGEEFEAHVVDLYQGILEFQIRGVVRANRNALQNFGRDLANRDDWQAMKTNIEDLERRVYQDCQQITNLNSRRHLEDLVSEAVSKRDLLHKQFDLQEELLIVQDQTLQTNLKSLDIHEQISRDTKAIRDLEVSRDAQQCIQAFRVQGSDDEQSYEWYKARIADRIEGTCEWFLHHENFQDWLGQRSGPLLVSADPGCGKSVLSKYLVDDYLRRHADKISYFFFKDQVQNRLRQALCALLHQLFSFMPSLISHALPTFRLDGPQMTENTETLWGILSAITQDSRMSSLIIVLDALDECKESDFLELTRKLKRQWTTPGDHSNSVRWLLTSRPYEQITSKFQAFVGDFPRIRIPGEQESKQIGREVQHVIEYRTDQIAQEFSLKKEVVDHLKSRLLEKSRFSRTYLWTYLVFHELEKGFKKTKKGVNKYIDELPKTVDAAYEKILDKSTDREKARRVLSILIAAERPLFLKELNVAANIETSPRTKCFEDIDLEPEEDFISTLGSWCGLLVSLYGDRIYFLHQTVREFLIQDPAAPTCLTIPDRSLSWARSISLVQANRMVSDICTTYLELEMNNEEIDIFTPQEEGEAHEEMSDLTPSPSQRERLRTNPSHLLLTRKQARIYLLLKRNAFLMYAAQYWGLHFRTSAFQHAEDLSIAVRLCCTDRPCVQRWRFFSSAFHANVVESLLDGDGANHEGNIGEENDGHEDSSIVNVLNSKPLILLVKLGIEPAVEMLVKQGSNVNVQDGIGSTPLYAAAVADDSGIARFLLENGAEPNLKDLKGRIPLDAAVLFGRRNVAKLLLEKGPIRMLCH